MHLGIIGYGNIAKSLTNLLEARPVEQITVLVRETSMDRAHTENQSSRAADKVEVTTDLAYLISVKPDLVVECAGHSAVEVLAPQVLAAGLSLVLVSIGAPANDELMAELRKTTIHGHAKLVFPQELSMA